MGHAYDTVDLHPTLGGGSLTVFGLLWLFLSTAVLLARAFRNFHWWASIIVIVVPVTSLIGCALGLVGLRRQQQRRGLALAGTVLNVAVLFSSVVAYLWR